MNLRLLSIVSQSSFQQGVERLRQIPDDEWPEMAEDFEACESWVKEEWEKAEKQFNQELMSGVISRSKIPDAERRQAMARREKLFVPMSILMVAVAHYTAKHSVEFLPNRYIAPHKGALKSLFGLAMPDCIREIAKLHPDEMNRFALEGMDQAYFFDSEDKASGENTSRLMALDAYESLCPDPPMKLILSRLLFGSGRLIRDNRQRVIEFLASTGRRVDVILASGLSAEEPAKQGGEPGIVNTHLYDSILREFLEIGCVGRKEVLAATVKKAISVSNRSPSDPRPRLDYWGYVSLNPTIEEDAHFQELFVAELLGNSKGAIKTDAKQRISALEKEGLWRAREHFDSHRKSYQWIFTSHTSKDVIKRRMIFVQRLWKSDESIAKAFLDSIPDDPDFFQCEGQINEVRRYIDEACEIAGFTPAVVKKICEKFGETPKKKIIKKASVARRFDNKPHRVPEIEDTFTSRLLGTKEVAAAALASLDRDADPIHLEQFLEAMLSLDCAARAKAVRQLRKLRKRALSSNRWQDQYQRARPFTVRFASTIILYLLEEPEFTDWIASNEHDCVEGQRNPEGTMRFLQMRLREWRECFEDTTPLPLLAFPDLPGYRISAKSLVDSLLQFEAAKKPVPDHEFTLALCRLEPGELDQLVDFDGELGGVFEYMKSGKILGTVFRPHWWVAARRTVAPLEKLKAFNKLQRPARQTDEGWEQFKEFFNLNNTFDSLDRNIPDLVTPAVFPPASASRVQWLDAIHFQEPKSVPSVYLYSLQHITLANTNRLGIAEERFQYSATPIYPIGPLAVFIESIVEDDCIDFTPSTYLPDNQKLAHQLFDCMSRDTMVMTSAVLVALVRGTSVKSEDTRASVISAWNRYAPVLQDAATVTAIAGALFTSFHHEHDDDVPTRFLPTRVHATFEQVALHSGLGAELIRDILIALFSVQWRKFPANLGMLAKLAVEISESAPPTSKSMKIVIKPDYPKAMQSMLAKLVKLLEQNG